MGTTESSQSPELGGVGDFAGQFSFRRQSPNVARLVRGEHSQKMEYEFPISDSNSATVVHHQTRHDGTSNHATVGDRQSHSRTSHHQFPHNDQLAAGIKLPASSSSSSEPPSRLWLSLTSCFGCRTRNASHSTLNPLRDKVHAIRIVRASNDLTPAVFDSHYNIITLEQLRECESNGSGNVSDSSESNHPQERESTQNGNGAVPAAPKETNRRMKKKKKQQRGPATAITSDDEDQEAAPT